MAGFDPSVSIALDASLFAQIANDAAQTIEAQTQQFIATIGVGDVIAAEVLPPQNGQDRLQIFGQTINAQLPPGIHPGEEILLQVTALQAQQIVVRNLGTIDSQAAQAALAEANARGEAVSAPNVRPTPPSVQPATLRAEASQAPPSPSTPPGRIDPGVYTSTQFAQGLPGRAASLPGTPLPGTPLPGTPLPATPLVQPPLPGAPLTPSPVPPAANGGAPNAAPANAPIAPPREVFVAASVQLPARQQEAIRRALEAAQRPGVAPADRAPFGTSRVTAAQLKEFAPEAALLARLRVPLSLQTLTAARASVTPVAQLPTVFARIETLLAKIANPDPRIATLRSLLPFIGRIDLANARALPQQLSAYVSHVLEGTEGKIADLVRLFAPPAEAADVPAPSLAQTQPALPQSDVLVQAKAAEREAALAQNLKAVIASVAASSSGSPQLAQALGDALRTVTAVQLQALAQQDRDPSSLVVPLPVQFYEGGRPAELHVSKDAPNGGRIDPNNFSISFVLDTKTMGTVGIDVQTVGRAVTVNVRTERTRAADRFTSSFDDLRSRLAQLRYRVAAMKAETLARAADRAPAPPVDDTPPKGRKEWQA